MTTAIISPAQNNTVSVDTISRNVRMKKKDFFLTLPEDTGRSERERKFAQYAEEFSAMEAAALSGALASGAVRLTANRPGKRGGSVRYEYVQETTRKSGKVAQLQDENARLRAENAALREATVNV